MANPQPPQVNDTRQRTPLPVAEPTNGAAETPVILGRTHVSGTRPPAPIGNGLSEILGDMEPAHWDPLLREEEGPLSDADLESSGGRGIVLGDYQVVRKLGVGGFGAVYLAREINGLGEVALKVLGRTMATRPDFLQRFYREAHTLAKLEHAHIVRGYEPFNARGWHCFAMEYMDGDSMQTWLKRLGKLTIGDAVHIALCMASALQYAHERNLVHRDIKPENILLTKQGRAKVADLGLAKAMDEDMSITRSGTGFGTPHYMAPEQARNAKHADPRSDIYALGTTLFHLLTGELPFKGETALELILAKEQAPLPSLRKFNSEVSEQLDLVIYKMLAKNINHRYQSCAELTRDLQRLDLANPTLSFVQDAAWSDSANGESVVDCPAAVTRQFAISVKSPSSVDLKQPDQWWEVRGHNSQGQPSVRRLTTRQLQELIKDERFDIKAEARLEADSGPFQPIISYNEFQSSVLRKQSVAMKTSTADSSVRLQKVYLEAQSRHAAEQERIRREQAEAATANNWPKKEDVQESLGSLHDLWLKNKHTSIGRVLVIACCVMGGILGLWGAFKIVSLFLSR